MPEGVADDVLPAESESDSPISSPMPVSSPMQFYRSKSAAEVHSIVWSNARRTADQEIKLEANPGYNDPVKWIREQLAQRARSNGENAARNILHRFMGGRRGA